MANDTASRIAAYFADHADDGDFARHPTSEPFLVTSIKPETEVIVYSTKGRGVWYVLDQSEHVPPIGVVGRYGLPHDRDVDWLRTINETRRLCFVGDADPVDLLVFAWLRSQIQITHVGINDILVADLGFHISPSNTIPLRRSETDAIELVQEVLTDYRDVVGQRCADLLDHGHKLEVEAVLNLANVDPEAFVASVLRMAFGPNIPDDPGGEQESRELAQTAGLDWIDLRKVVIPMSIIALVPERVAREYTMLPLKEEDGALEFVFCDPHNIETLEKLRFTLNRRIEQVVAPRSHIEAAINWYYGPPP